jgi:hypothetical protein
MKKSHGIPRDSLTADSLNNLGLSMLEMGLAEQAFAAWDEALTETSWAF